MKPVVVDTNILSLIFKKHSLSEPYLDFIENRSLVNGGESHANRRSGF